MSFMGVRWEKWAEENPECKPPPRDCESDGERSGAVEPRTRCRANCGGFLSYLPDSRNFRPVAGRISDCLSECCFPASNVRLVHHAFTIGRNSEEKDEDQPE